MSRARRIATAAALVPLVLAGCGRGDAPGGGGQSVAAALGDGADDAGYARAVEVREFRFPDDHGPHPDFRNEWWYYTGNLVTPAGRRFGYQLTLFRIALTPDPIASESAWRGRQLYMGHFALSDLDSGEHHHFERFGRAAGELAGASNPPLRVWLDNWSIEALDESGFPVRIKAADGEVAIDLTLDPDKPAVLNGQEGLSRKSAEPGNASYYYSVTRLATAGSVRIGEANYLVRGASWLDREWSTSALAEDQAGWDWFALQFAEGRDLMIYQLRRKDGSVDPASAGTLVSAAGEARPLKREDLALEALSYWTSPTTGIRYPSRWRLALPAEGLELEVEPVMVDQEMDVTVRYWEGAVEARGRDGDQEVVAVGYMELAGYE